MMNDMKDIKNIPDDGILRSCCFTCDFKAFLFVAQFIFSMIIFSVSVAMIIIDNNTPLFISLLSLVVGVWLPTPKHPENEK